MDFNFLNNRMSKKLQIAIKTSLLAGEKILDIYYSDQFEAEMKKDGSPLTRADKASHNTVVRELSKLGIPILSEEGAKIDYSTRKKWSKFWLIDPLDGTKEFIKKNGEFTVNIALVENQIPILGVVYTPVTKELYFAEKDFGSFKIESIEKFDELSLKQAITLSESSSPKNYTIVVSRSHLNKETTDYITEKKQMFNEILLKQFGSSLKICKVAEGKAHCYPRLGPTMEWDTAAAHAVVKYSGKRLFNFNTNDELIYNKESLLNPFFVTE
jgi:3'(2'), 5'-bisphosphate nucleotidase